MIKPIIEVIHFGLTRRLIACEGCVAVALAACFMAALSGCTSLEAPISEPAPSQTDITRISPTSPVQGVPLQIVVGSAAPDVVSRYLVSYTYVSGDSIASSYGATFDYNGGSIQSIIPGDLSSLPRTVSANIGIDFTPESGLAGYTDHVEIPVEPDFGASYFWEPSPADPPVELLLEVPRPPILRRIFCSSTDFLKVRFDKSSEGNVIPTVIVVMYDELYQDPIRRIRPSFPVTSDPAEGYALQVDGKLGGKRLHPFRMNLAASPLLIELRIVPAGDSYRVVEA
jgi:hypothetical protein